MEQEYVFGSGSGGRRQGQLKNPCFRADPCGCWDIALWGWHSREPAHASPKGLKLLSLLRYDGFPLLQAKLFERPQDQLMPSLCQARSSAPSSPAPRRTKQVNTGAALQPWESVGASFPRSSG